MRWSPVTRVRPLAGASLALALVASLAACGSDESTDPTEPSSTASLSEPEDESASPSPDTQQEDDVMDIEIAIGDEVFTATVDDSAAGRDLVAQLPVTLEMRDHGSVEKTGALPAPLSLDGQPAGADPDVGDLGYYAPGNDLVLYYGDQSYFAGIVVLGRLGDGAAEAISTMAGTVTVTVSAAS